MVDYHEVIPIISNEVQNILEIETIGVLNSCNRVLADDIYSLIDVPQYDRSLVDGYAISQPSDIKLDKWEIYGETIIGKQHDFMHLPDKKAIYVPTGGILPQNTYCVIKIEDTKVIDDENGKSIQILQIGPQGSNIEFKGFDIRYNELLIKKNCIIDYKKVGLLSAVGITEVKVFKKPTVAIIVTGHEIKKPGENLVIGEVFDSSSPLLRAFINNFGAKISEIHFVGESEEEISRKILTIENSDLIITTGGTSVGKADNVTKSVEKLGSVIFHGINIRPGKPVLFGRINNKLILGLPGFTTSSAVTANLILPIIFSKLLSQKIPSPKPRRLLVDNRLKSFPGWYRIIPGYEKDGYFYSTYKTSSAITSFSNAEGYVLLRPDDNDVQLGEEVIYYTFLKSFF